MDTTKRPHYLRPVKSVQAPSQIVSVDVRLHTSGLMAGYAIFSRRSGKSWEARKERAFTNAEEFWAWLQSVGKKDRCTWVMSSNWPRLCLPIGLDRATEEWGWTVGKSALSPGCFWIQLQGHAREIEIVDLANWWGSCPDDIEVDVDKIPDIYMASRLTAEAIHRLVTSVISYALANDLGCVQPTIGSWSMNLWRHWHSGKKVCVHADTATSKLERAAYYGGECRVNRVGQYKGEYYALDVNNLYPYIQGAYLMPYHLPEPQPAIMEGELEHLGNGIGAIARVRISSTSQTFPVRTQGRTIFALGDYWTTLAQPELSLAYRLGCVKEVAEYKIYYCTDLFSAWADRLWRLRFASKQGGHKTLAALLKMLGVSLHGRFGKRAVDWRECETAAPKPWQRWIEQDSKGDWRVHRAIGDNVTCKWASDDEPFDSFPAVAAFATSAARVYMHELRAIAGERECWYQFTDSLIVTATGRERLLAAGMIDASALGKLKTDSVFSNVNIRGPAWILAGSELRASGIGKYSEVIGPDRYNVIHHTSPMGIVTSNGMASYAEIPVQTEYPPPELCGTADADGWVTPPVLSL